MIPISAVTAAYTQTFLDAFASLGIEPWAGIEMDGAWGQTTLRFGLHRPSVTGPIFVYRVHSSQAGYTCPDAGLVTCRSIP